MVGPPRGFPPKGQRALKSQVKKPPGPQMDLKPPDLTVKGGDNGSSTTDFVNFPVDLRGQRKSVYHSEMENITSRLAKAMDTFETLYDESLEEDSLLSDITQQVNSLEGGQMKSQMKSFINKYKDTLEQADAVREEREEILGSLADWFSTQGLEREFTTLSYDEKDEDESDRTMRESLMNTKMGFDKLRSLKSEISNIKASGGNAKDLEREKLKLQKDVIDKFKTYQKQKVETEQIAEEHASDAWKYAAGEICELMKKIRTTATGDVDSLVKELETLLKEVEKQVEIVARLKFQLQEKQLMCTKYADDNVYLTTELTKTTSSLQKIKKEYKKLLKLPKSQLGQQSAITETENEDEVEHSNFGGDSMILKAKLKDYQKQVDMLKKSQEKAEAQLHKIKVKLSEKESTIEHLEHDKKELIKQVMKSPKNQTTQQPFTEHLSGSHISLTRKPSANNICIKCHANLHNSTTFLEERMPSKQVANLNQISNHSSGKQDHPAIVNELKSACEAKEREIQTLQKTIEQLELDLNKSQQDINRFHDEINQQRVAPPPTPVPAAPSIEVKDAVVQTECPLSKLKIQQGKFAVKDLKHHLVEDPLDVEKLQSAAKEKLGHLQSRESHLFNQTNMRSRGMQTDPASDPLGAWTQGVNRTISTMHYTPPKPPADWISFDPTQLQPRPGKLALGNAMCHGVSPDDVKRDIKIAGDYMARELGRMVQGIEGFVQYTTEHIITEAKDMALANSKLHTHLTAKEKKKLDKSSADSILSYSDKDEWTNKTIGSVNERGDQAMATMRKIQNMYVDNLQQLMNDYNALFAIINKNDQISLEIKRSKSHGSLLDHDDPLGGDRYKTESSADIGATGVIPVSARSSKSAGLAIERSGENTSSHSHKLTGPRAPVKLATTMLPKTGDIKLTTIKKDGVRALPEASEKVRRRIKPAPLSHKKMLQKQKILLSKLSEKKPQMPMPTEEEIKNIHWSEIPEEYFQRFNVDEWQKTILDVSDKMTAQKTFGDIVAQTGLHDVDNIASVQQEMMLQQDNVAIPVPETQTDSKLPPIDKKHAPMKTYPSLRS